MSTVPASLVRYQQALEDAIRRDLDTAAPRRRRVAVRLLLAGAATAAAALGLLNVLSTHGPWVVRSASAESVVRHAAAALAQTPGTILHIDMAGSQRNPDGSTITWNDESWQLESAPYSRRQIETGPDGSTVESASGPGGDQVYDRSRNTIYIDSQTTQSSQTAQPSQKAQPRQFELKPGPRPGTYVLRLPAPALNVKAIIISAKQARALRDGTDSLAFKLRKRGGAAALTLIPTPSLPSISDPGSSDSSDPDPDSAAFRDQILALLDSGAAHVEGHKTIDGQDTIEITSADGHTTYYVDPDSYKPVELDTRGTGGGTTLRFETYEELVADGNSSLLNLAAQHPNATIDRNPSHYQAAQARLFPHG